jgi:Fe-S oxidoreductase
MDENEVKFLEEYKVLCLKYGIIVSGCGCCGSPFLSNANEGEILDNIKHLQDEG